MNKPRSAKETKYIPTQNLAMPVIATIVKSDFPGKIMIQHNSHEPKSAKLVSTVDRYTLAQEKSIGRQVLVVFENGDPNLPVITGVMENVLEDIIEIEMPEEPVRATIDDKKQLFEAKEQITLKCGQASITLNKHGKIIIKGAEVISRASGTNKIKGSNIQLN